LRQLWNVDEPIAILNLRIVVSERLRHNTGLLMFITALVNGCREATKARL
jgi:hypothetical protein